VTALAGRVPRLKLVLTRKPAGVQVVMNGANATALVGIDTPVDLGSYDVVVTARDIAPGARTSTSPRRASWSPW
jgi:hypothetical protein